MIDMELYQRAFDALPPRTREVFWLHRVGDLSYEEIAARLGITTEEVQKEMASALVKIGRSVDEAERQATLASWEYRRWCLWRLRHWRSWFLSPVDYADEHAHLTSISPLADTPPDRSTDESGR